MPIQKLSRLRLDRGSLVRRLTVAVLIGGLLLTLIQALLLNLWLEPLRDQFLEGRVQLVNSLRRSLALLPPAQRQALADSLRTPQSRVMRLDAMPPLRDEWLPPPASMVRQRMLEQLDPGIQLDLDTRDTNRVLIRMSWPQDDGGRREYWSVEFVAEPPLRAMGWTVIAWLSALVLSAVAATLLTLRAITRPLQQLAEQLAQQGLQASDSLRPLQLPPGAGSELQSLVDAFNRLVQQLQARQRERQQLLAGVSHDLRTPLARLRLRVETQVDGPQAALLEADVRALQHICEQFLHYVQGDSAPRPGPPAPLRALLAEIAEPYRPQGLQLHLDPLLPPRLPEVPETALRRLLVNLIDNAFAHGGPPVLLQLLLDPRPEGAGLRLMVEDGGAGLSQAAFEQALQPFVRLSERTAEGHCGLGLAIAAQMARQLGAQLRVRERQDGQRFAVELLLPPA